MLPIYVISNGDLFREALNAISTVVGENTFTTAIYISGVFAVLGASLSYVKSKNLMALGSWFGTYFFVIAVLLAPKTSVQIIDSSDPGRADLTVDNVPYGIAMPASIVTEVGHALAQSFDDVFHMPNDESYTKTGMLFGSNLFRLSTAVQIDSSKLKSQINDYIKNCVFGDILINHKYTLDEVVHSKDIWGTITQNPSPVRGLYMDGQFQTCQSATPLLTKSMADASGQSAINRFATNVAGQNEFLKENFATMLSSSYQNYVGISQSASKILQQNMAINAFRSAVSNYAASTGNAAALENYSTTTSLEKMRLSWATSREIATHTLPLMQTVLLVLMLCMFPVIVLLGIQPGLGFGVIKNYLYTLLWLETWPLMFAILNFAATFYLKGHTSAMGAGGVTLSNANLLAQEHSDVAGIAGYLTLAIPFLSMGIVKGMAFAFNNAAQYIGGMTHSIIQGASSEAAMGNISVGNTNAHNVSANNLSANKHDSNYTNMHGMMTNQMGNGATVMDTASGDSIYNTAPAISQLATSVNAGHMVSSALSQQADHSMASALSHRSSFDQSVSSAFSDAQSYDHQIQNGSNLSNSYQDQQTANYDKSISNMMSIAHSYGTTHNMSDQDAFKHLTQASMDAKAGFNSNNSLPGKIIGFATGLSAGGSVSTSAQGQSTHDASSSTSASSSIDNKATSDFRENMSTAMQYSQSHNLNESSSLANSAGVRLSQDLRQAATESQSYSADLNQSSRLSQAASFSEQNSASIQQNFNQGFANYVHEHDPQRANVILANTSSQSIALQREQMAQDYLHQYTQNLENSFSNNQGQDPSSTFNSGSQQVGAMASNSIHNAQSTGSRAIGNASANVSYDSGKAQALASNTQSNIESRARGIGESGSNMASSHQQAKVKTENTINTATAISKEGLIEHGMGFKKLKESL